MNELWKWIRDDFKIGPLEHLELDTLSPIHLVSDSIAIRLCYWRQIRKDAYGLDSIRDYREHTEEIPMRKICRASGTAEVADLIMSAIRYAALCVLPFRKPKGYKILHRKTVLAPAPRLRWPRLVARSPRTQARRP